jgi:hypothetical protein
MQAQHKNKTVLTKIKITKSILPKSDSLDSEIFWDPKKSKLINDSSRNTPRLEVLKAQNGKSKGDIIKNIEKLKKTLTKNMENPKREIEIMDNIKKQV